MAAIRSKKEQAPDAAHRRTQSQGRRNSRFALNMKMVMPMANAYANK